MKPSADMATEFQFSVPVEVTSVHEEPASADLQILRPSTTAV